MVDLVAYIESLTDSPRQIEALLAGRTAREYSSNVIVYTQGEKEDRIYYLSTGRVKLAVFDQNGNEKPLWVVAPGQFFGMPGAFGSRAHGVTSLTLSPSLIYPIPLSALAQWLERFPEMSFSLMESLADIMWMVEQQLCSAYFRDVRGKVVVALLDWLRSPHDPRSQPDGKVQVVKMTKSELGIVAGLSRVTVSKVLRALESEGLVQVRRGAVTVVNLPGLYRHASV